MEEEKVEVSARAHLVYMVTACSHTSSEERLYYALLVL